MSKPLSPGEVQNQAAGQSDLSLSQFIDPGPSALINRGIIWQRKRTFQTWAHQLHFDFSINTFL